MQERESSMQRRDADDAREGATVWDSGFGLCAVHGTRHLCDLPESRVRPAMCLTPQDHWPPIKNSMLGRFTQHSVLTP